MDNCLWTRRGVIAGAALAPLNLCERNARDNWQSLPKHLPARNSRGSCIRLALLGAKEKILLCELLVSVDDNPKPRAFFTKFLSIKTRTT